MNKEKLTRLKCELSKFPYLGGNKVGGIIHGDVKNIIYRIGKMETPNGSSAVQRVLDKRICSQKINIPFLDEEPVRDLSPEAREELEAARAIKLVEIRKNYSLEQNAFIQNVEDLCKELFDCRSSLKRYSELFCMVNYAEGKEMVFSFQVLSYPVTKNIRYLMDALNDWRFEGTDLSARNAGKLPGKTRKGIRDAKRILSNTFREVKDALKNTVDSLFSTFSSGDLYDNLMQPPTYSEMKVTDFKLPDAFKPLNDLRKLARLAKETRKAMKKETEAGSTPSAKARGRKPKVRQRILEVLRGGAVTLPVLAVKVYGNDSPVCRQNIMRMLKSLSAAGINIRTVDSDGEVEVSLF